MAIEIECHVDFGVPWDGLNAFWGPFKVGDKQAGCCMAYQVEIITMLAVLGFESAFKEQRPPNAVAKVRHALRISASGREHKIKTALWAFGLPLTTIGARGMSRLPAFDFGGPMRHHASAPGEHGSRPL